MELFFVLLLVWQKFADQISEQINHRILNLLLFQAPYFIYLLYSVPINRKKDAKLIMPPAPLALA